MDTSRLEGWVAVVTGASHGVGRATAIALAQEGADIVLAARNELELHSTAEVIRETGRKAFVCVTDISRLEQVDNLAQTTLREFGRIDLLINNAGGWAGRGPFDEMDMAKMAEMVDVDVKGTLLVTRALLPQMIRQRQGTIIGIAAIDAIPGREEVVAYAMVKSALSAFHRSLRQEVRPFGVRVATLYPGPVASDLTYAPDPSALRSKEGVPRLALRDVVQAILFVARAPDYCMVEDIVLTPTEQR